MCDFTRSRDANTVDELWLLEHPPTYTTGIASKPEHDTVQLVFRSSGLIAVDKSPTTDLAS